MSSEKKDCIYCNGNGENTCPICLGRGTRIEVSAAFRIPVTRLVTCTYCWGRGKKKCIYCDGTGKV